VDPEVCAVGNAGCRPPEWLPWPMGRSDARHSGGTGGRPDTCAQCHAVARPQAL